MVDERLCLPRLRGHTENLSPISTSLIPSPQGAFVENGLTCVNTSFVRRPHSLSSNALSKLTMPRLPFRQFPVILSSSIVCTFWTCILRLGPFGVFAAQRYRSSCRRASK